MSDFKELTPGEAWAAVEFARHEDRPNARDYIGRLFGGWVELSGDRNRANDPAIVTGLGSFRDHGTVAVIGHQKGHNLKENIDVNFGMGHPEGYRKARRVMKMAERFGFPLFTLVNTAGAYPGVAAEQHGQGGAIAASQAEMAALRTPTVACITGEGGSGGAIALGLADRVLMQENAFYSIISPDGAVAILWEKQARGDINKLKKLVDENKARMAAAFRLDVDYYAKLGVIDGIVREPHGGAQADYDLAAQLLGDSLETALLEIKDTPPDELVRSRRQKFRNMGVYKEGREEVKLSRGQKVAAAFKKLFPVRATWGSWLE